MIKSLLLLCIVCVAFTQTYSQEVLLYDTSTVEVRNYNNGKIADYKTDPHFQYEKALQPPASLWERFWAWFWNKVGELLSTRNGRRTFTTVAVVIAAAILVFTIMKFTGMTRAGLFGEKNTGERIPYSVFEEDIHSISFQEAIERAISEGNLRLAVRLLYLQTLKKLSDRQLINWQINKTNIAYVHELSGTSYQQPFNQLTLTFETNWYGDRHIEAAAFNEVKQEFNQFNEQIR